MSMKVHVLTNWQNEEWLAPLFLHHYSWADKITIVLEPSTNDRTREEIAAFQQQDPLTRWRQFEGKGSPAGSGADNDDVVMSVLWHLLLPLFDDC